MMHSASVVVLIYSPLHISPTAPVFLKQGPGNVWLCVLTRAGAEKQGHRSNSVQMDFDATSEKGLLISYFESEIIRDL